MGGVDQQRLECPPLALDLLQVALEIRVVLQVARQHFGALAQRMRNPLDLILVGCAYVFVRAYLSKLLLVPLLRGVVARAVGVALWRRDA